MTGASESHALAVGQRLGQYEIVDVLAVGAVRIEYAALDRDVARRVTVGEYFPKDLASRQQDGQVRKESATAFDLGLDDFLARARSLAAIDHPNLVKVRAHLRANGTGYVVTDATDCTPLAKHVETRGTLSEKELVNILYPVLDALEGVHDAGLVHGRLWPVGIMVREDGAPLLAGHRAIGPASAPRQGSGAMAPLAGGVAPGYAALEQYSHAAAIGPWTDIYALGAVAYRCLTGRAPRDAPGRVLVEEDLRAELAAPESCTPGTVAAIESALAVRVVDRPASVADWRTMLTSPPPARELTVRSSARGRPGPVPPAARVSARGFPPPEKRLSTAVRPDAPTTRRRAARMGGQPLGERRKARWVAPAASLLAAAGILTWVDAGLLRAPADHPDVPSSGTQPAAASPATRLVAPPSVPPLAEPPAAPDTLTLELIPADAEVRFVANSLLYRPGMRLPSGAHRLLVTRAGYVAEWRTVHVQGDTRQRITLVPRSDRAR